jgi:hypothetical protein
VNARRVSKKIQRIAQGFLGTRPKRCGRGMIKKN